MNIPDTTGSSKTAPEATPAVRRPQQSATENLVDSIMARNQPSAARPKRRPSVSIAELTTGTLHEAVAKALDPRKLPTLESEFCRMGDLRRLFSIVRSTAYVLAKEGHIKTCSLRRKGQARSIRLVSVPSVRAYLNRLLAEQNPERAETDVKSEKGGTE